MPGGPWSDYQNPLLSGLFGTFQESAQAGDDTSSVWTALRQAAGNWYYQSQGITPPASAAELESTGASVLSAQGVSAANVSTYRGIAGSWQQAKTNLQALNPADQIPGEAIFVPPWSTTANSAVPDRYRIRVEWTQIQENGELTQRWGSYELSGPLSSINNALYQATAIALRERNSGVVSSASVPQATDYEIEQI